MGLAHNILEDLGSLNTDLGVNILSSIGDALETLEDFDGAFDAYLWALEIRKEIGALHTVGAASLLDSIGLAWCRKGDSTKALQSFSFSRRIRQLVTSADKKPAYVHAPNSCTEQDFFL